MNAEEELFEPIPHRNATTQKNLNFCKSRFSSWSFYETNKNRRCKSMTSSARTRTNDSNSRLDISNYFVDRRIEIFDIFRVLVDTTHVPKHFCTFEFPGITQKSADEWQEKNYQRILRLSWETPFVWDLTRQKARPRRRKITDANRISVPAILFETTNRDLCTLFPEQPPSSDIFL